MPALLRFQRWLSFHIRLKSFRVAAIVNCRLEFIAVYDVTFAVDFDFNQVWPISMIVYSNRRSSLVTFCFYFTGDFYHVLNRILPLD